MRASVLPTLLIITAVIVALIVFVLPAEQKIQKELPDYTEYQTPKIEDPLPTPPEADETTPSVFLKDAKDIAPEDREPYTDANNQLKYSSGVCKTDADCYASGCTSQICSNDRWLITTCEVRDDFPDRNVYACGCFQSACAWFK